VILFGVFFTMGYVVGRNSAPASAASLPQSTVATSPRPDAAAPATQSPAQSSVPAPSAAPPPQEQAKEPMTVITKTVVPPEKPSEKHVRHEAAPRPAQPPTRKETAAGGVVPVNPGPGNMYLQVAAAAQPQAGVVVDTLKQKGFPALLTQGPNATLFRVMVGPFADAAALGKAKADLESAGFRPLVRK